MLNQDQEKAADGFFNFLMNPKEKEFIISGSAGTGKTYLMGYLIDQIIPRYEKSCKLLGMKPIYTSVYMTATTNKAAEVLASATKRPAETIYTHLGLAVCNDYNSGETYIKKVPRKWRIHTGEIIFIDECSMIDYQLSKKILESTIDCKIVYVGDHCQLAPVKDPISPIYKRQIPFFELKQQMRNNGSRPLQNICNQLRQTVETGIFKPIQLVPGSIELLDDEAMQRIMGIEFKNSNPNHTTALAYTNQRVDQYSTYIRQDIHNILEPYKEGEVLINNAPLTIGQSHIAVEEPIRIKSIKRNKTNNILEDYPIDCYIVHAFNRFKGEFDSWIPYNKEDYKNRLKQYASNKDWKRYFFLKESFLNLRTKDASTIHKAQGSTFDTVFIDLEDISCCTNPDMAARLLYVAFSRAKSKVFLYGNLKTKFGGVIQAN